MSATYTNFTTQIELIRQTFTKLTEDTSNQELVFTILQATHNIKNDAMVGAHEYLAGFAHVTESVLFKLNHGEIKLDEELNRLLDACFVHIAAIIDAIQQSTQPDMETRAYGEMLVVNLIMIYLEEGEFLSF